MQFQALIKTMSLQELSSNARSVIFPCIRKATDSAPHISDIYPKKSTNLPGKADGS
jgi:hypothetical protein